MQTEQREEFFVYQIQKKAHVKFIKWILLSLFSG
jgi:hypothetical protein